MESSQYLTDAKLPRFIVLACVLAVTGLFVTCIQPASNMQEASPVLEFPEIGLDDTVAYHGYSTRFFRDSEGNTVQISLNQNTGRVMHIWADAANESISFTARAENGQPAKLAWDSQGARVFSEGTRRYVQYTLSSKEHSVYVGLFVLSSMRIERDFQYQGRHRQPFDSEPFIPRQLTEVIHNIENIERLPADARDRHLELLNAKSLEGLRSRLTPRIESLSDSHLLVEHSTFDGKNHLSFELTVDKDRASIAVTNDRIAIHSLDGHSVQLTIKVGTDSPSLTPLQSKDIFNSDFIQFYGRIKSESDVPQKDNDRDEKSVRFRRLERQVKGLELLSTEEKFLASMPNYATYFGRDMMMSASCWNRCGSPRCWSM